MNTILSLNSEPQTWAQSIQAYQRSKTTLGWDPSEVLPSKQVKHFDVSRQTREIDPLLMKHRDPEVESKRQQREDERLRTTLQRADDWRLKVERSYNIVNNQSHLTGTDAEKKSAATYRRARYPDSKVTYNIVNNVPRENALSLALIHRESDAPWAMPHKEVTMEGGKKPLSHFRREVDVLSNRYLRDHDERVKQEERSLRELTVEKYRQTHDYDPVAGRYYDDEKERNFVRTREELESLQGEAQRNRLPPSVRYSEGNEYDIISKEARDKTKEESSGRAQDRGLSRKVRNQQIREENIRQHERATALSEERALNRPSYQRHIERLHKGYDVISNQVFTGRTGKPPPPPRTRPPAPVWDRLSGPEEALDVSGQRPGAEASQADVGERNELDRGEQPHSTADTRGDHTQEQEQEQENLGSHASAPQPSADGESPRKFSSEKSLGRNTKVAGTIVPPLELAWQADGEVRASCFQK